MQLQFAAVGASDLPAEQQADTAAFGFGAVQRHEQVIGIGNAATVVMQTDPGDAGLFADTDRNICGTGFGSVAQQIDQQRFQLLGIGAQRRAVFRPLAIKRRQWQQTRAQGAPAQRRDLRHRQPRQLCIAGDELRQVIGARFNGGQCLLARSDIERLFTQALRQRTDRRQRIAHFMTEHADQFLPGLLFLFSQLLTQILGQQHAVPFFARQIQCTPDKGGGRRRGIGLPVAVVTTQTQCLHRQSAAAGNAVRQQHGRGGVGTAQAIVVVDLQQRTGPMPGQLGDGQLLHGDAAARIGARLTQALKFNVQRIEFR